MTYHHKPNWYRATEQAFRHYRQNREALEYYKNAIERAVLERQNVEFMKGGSGPSAPQLRVLEAWESSEIVQVLLARCSAVEKALRNLLYRQDLYDIILLHYFDGHAVEEIAEMWGCSDSTIHRRRRDAVERSIPFIQQGEEQVYNKENYAHDMR